MLPAQAGAQKQHTRETAFGIRNATLSHFRKMFPWQHAPTTSVRSILQNLRRNVFRNSFAPGCCECVFFVKFASNIWEEFDIAAMCPLRVRNKHCFVHLDCSTTSLYAQKHAGSDQRPTTAVRLFLTEVIAVMAFEPVLNSISIRRTHLQSFFGNRFGLSGESTIVSSNFRATSPPTKCRGLAA